MSCTSFKGIIKQCNYNNGGIKAIYINDSALVSAIDYNVDTHTINAVTTSFYFIEFDLTRNTSNMVTTPQIDLLTRSSFYETKINLVFNRREANSSKSLMLLGEGQRYLDIIFLDMNGIYWYVSKCQMEGGPESSGVTRLDGSRYSITFTSQEDWRPYVVNPTIIPGLTQLKN